MTPRSCVIRRAVKAVDCLVTVHKLSTGYSTSAKNRTPWNSLSK
jgi:hypothetical protein